jgi:hypothetical protein
VIDIEFTAVAIVETRDTMSTSDIKLFLEIFVPVIEP